MPGNDLGGPRDPEKPDLGEDLRPWARFRFRQIPPHVGADPHRPTAYAERPGDIHRLLLFRFYRILKRRVFGDAHQEHSRLIPSSFRQPYRKIKLFRLSRRQSGHRTASKKT